MLRLWEFLELYKIASILLPLFSWLHFLHLPHFPHHSPVSDHTGLLVIPRTHHRLSLYILCFLSLKVSLFPPGDLQGSILLPWSLFWNITLLVSPSLITLPKLINYPFLTLPMDLSSFRFLDHTHGHNHNNAALTNNLKSHGIQP